MASAPNEKPHVKLSMEAEYARVMAELGRAIPPASQRIIDKAAADAKKNAENASAVKSLETKPAHLPMFRWASRRRKTKRVKCDKRSEVRSNQPESAIPVPAEMSASYVKYPTVRPKRSGVCIRTSCKLTRIQQQCILFNERYRVAI